MKFANRKINKRKRRFEHYFLADPWKLFKPSLEATTSQQQLFLESFYAVNTSENTEMMLERNTHLSYIHISLNHRIPTYIIKKYNLAFFIILAKR